MLRVLLALWLALLSFPASAAPEWRAAPEPITERPDIPAPDGGWWLEDGQYARVYGAVADKVTVRRLADHAATATPELGRRLGVPTGGTVDVYLAPTRAFFSSVQPGTPPDWADGTAWASLGLVFLHAPDARAGTATPLETVLDHELVHVLLGRAFHPQPVPRWLQEGLAQFYAGEVGPQTAEALAQAGGAGELLPLAQITRGFPRDPVTAQLAYAESADFVAFVHAQYGEEALRKLIRAIGGGQSFEDAVYTATGQDAKALEGAWLEQWASPWLRVVRIANSSVLWFVGSLAIVFGAYRRWKRGRDKLRAWEAEEARRLAALTPKPAPLFPLHPVTAYSGEDDVVVPLRPQVRRVEPYH